MPSSRQWTPGHPMYLDSLFINRVVLPTLPRRSTQDEFAPSLPPETSDRACSDSSAATAEILSRSPSPQESPKTDCDVFGGNYDRCPATPAKQNQKLSEARRSTTQSKTSSSDEGEADADYRSRSVRKASKLQAHSAVERKYRSGLCARRLSG